MFIAVSQLHPNLIFEDKAGRYAGGVTTLSITASSLMTLSVTTFLITTLSITFK